MSETKKAPLDQAAGSVPVPNGSSNAEAHDTPSVPHDLNSAHEKREQPSDIDHDATPGLGSTNRSRDKGPPNWQNQNDILDAASHGDTVSGTDAVNRDLSQLKHDQHPQGSSGEQSGPTGLSIGRRNMEEEGTSRHDAMQKDLMAGKVSRDGEGSAGLPFDAGK